MFRSRYHDIMSIVIKILKKMSGLLKNEFIKLIEHYISGVAFLFCRMNLIIRNLKCLLSELSQIILTRFQIILKTLV